MTTFDHGPCRNPTYGRPCHCGALHANEAWRYDQHRVAEVLRGVHEARDALYRQRDGLTRAVKAIRNPASPLRGYGGLAQTIRDANAKTNLALAAVEEAIGACERARNSPTYVGNMSAFGEIV